MTLTPTLIIDTREQRGGTFAKSGAKLLTYILIRDIMEYMNIANTLKSAAKRSGLSMLAISKATGLNYQTVHGFLTGERDIAVSTAQALADLLDLELRPKAAGTVKKGGR